MSGEGPAAAPGRGGFWGAGALGGRPSGSGGPLGLSHPVEPAVGIAGRFDRGPSYLCRRAALRLEAALRGTTDRVDQRGESRVRYGEEGAFPHWWDLAAGAFKQVKPGLCRSLRPLGELR